MRSSTLFFGAALIASISVSACSSDSSSPSDDPDGSSGPIDSGTAIDSGTVATDAGDAATEQVTATFGGTMYTFTNIVFAQVSTNGFTQITASQGGIGIPNINLFFDPKLGTTTCATGSNANITFSASKSESYQAFGTKGACSIAVTQFGTVGNLIEGSFTATVKETNGATLQGTGAFHVLRTK